MKTLLTCAVLVAGAAGPPSPRAVRFEEGVLAVDARGMPLWTLLEDVARSTGMRLVFVGGAPAQAVTVTLHGKPANVIRDLMTAAKARYGIALDPTGTHVTRLIVLGENAAVSPRPGLAAGAETEEPPALPGSDDVPRNVLRVVSTAPPAEAEREGLLSVTPSAAPPGAPLPAFRSRDVPPPRPAHLAGREEAPVPASVRMEIVHDETPSTSMNPHADRDGHAPSP